MDFQNEIKSLNFEMESQRYEVKCFMVKSPNFKIWSRSFDLLSQNFYFKEAKIILTSSFQFSYF